MSSWIRTPSGRALPNNSNSASMRRVSATVSASGCFWMVRMTAGCPPIPASPRLLAAAPSRTSAICPSRMDDPSGSTLTTVSPSSSALSNRARLRMRRSVCASGMNPPEELTLDSSIAASTSCSVTPVAASLAGSTNTWYSRTSPPITVICETPGTESRRRRMSHCASVRSCAGATSGLSLVSPTARICPMIEDTGPRKGLVPSGNVPATSATFSATIWRAR
jgi:hypothetical protein